MRSVFTMLRFHVCFEYFDVNYVDVANAYDDDEHNLSPYARALFFPHSPNVIQIMTRNIHHTFSHKMKQNMPEKKSSKQAMHITHCTRIYCILHENAQTMPPKNMRCNTSEYRLEHVQICHGKIIIYSII